MDVVIIGGSAHLVRTAVVNDYYPILMNIQLFAHTKYPAQSIVNNTILDWRDIWVCAVVYR